MWSLSSDSDFDRRHLRRLEVVRPYYDWISKHGVSVDGDNSTGLFVRTGACAFDERIPEISQAQALTKSIGNDVPFPT